MFAINTTLKYIYIFIPLILFYLLKKNLGRFIITKKKKKKKKKKKLYKRKPKTLGYSYL